jgi:hypothetical protein
VLARVVPTIVFHGDRDLTVNAVNADHVLTPWVQAADEWDSTHRPDQHVRVERGQVSGGYAYTRSIYHDPHGRVLMEKWIVHQMGHAWSGGSPRGSYSDPKGPNASAEMVRFFSEHPQGWDQRTLGRSSGVRAPQAPTTVGPLLESAAHHLVPLSSVDDDALGDEPATNHSPVRPPVY